MEDKDIEKNIDEDVDEENSGGSVGDFFSSLESFQKKENKNTENVEKTKDQEDQNIFIKNSDTSGKEDKTKNFQPRVTEERFNATRSELLRSKDKWDHAKKVFAKMKDDFDLDDDAVEKLESVFSYEPKPENLRALEDESIEPFERVRRSLKSDMNNIKKYSLLQDPDIMLDFLKIAYKKSSKEDKAIINKEIGDRLEVSPEETCQWLLSQASEYWNKYGKDLGEKKSNNEEMIQELSKENEILKKKIAKLEEKGYTDIMHGSDEYQGRKVSVPKINRRSSENFFANLVD